MSNDAIKLHHIFARYFLFHFLNIDAIYSFNNLQEYQIVSSESVESSKSLRSNAKWHWLSVSWTTQVANPRNYCWRKKSVNRSNCRRRNHCETHSLMAVSHAFLSLWFRANLVKIMRYHCGAKPYFWVNKFILFRIPFTFAVHFCMCLCWTPSYLCCLLL